MENRADKNRQTFELLAPAGSLEIFKAVIAAGADAVYVGGSRFGARAYANNFTDEELAEALDYAHLYGRKVYLTVNTLLKNHEIRELEAYLRPFYERGLDAVLVQDFGALTAVHAWFPDLAIHTSTQMTVTGPEAARMFSALGVTRMVMARELSLVEMKQIHDETGMELEAFVHGALCYCYSGQCLLSSMLGGRSGNRGRCAQPCRLPYAVLDASQRQYRPDSYVLSLKDLCGIRDLQKLADAGVYSLKIEGRMKQIPYVAGVVSIYRQAIDHFLETGDPAVPDAVYQNLLDLGNRCGFTDGYYSRQNGSDMVTFQKPSYEKTNEALQRQIVETYGAGAAKIPVSGKLVLQLGKPAYYEVSAQGTTAAATGMEVMPAQKKPLAAGDVRDRMKKTGDTPYVMDGIQMQMQEGVFLPNGALNQLRREALENLLNAQLQPYRRTAAVETEAVWANTECMERTNEAVFCVVGERAQLQPVLAASCVTAVCLDLEAYHWETLQTQLKEDLLAVAAAKKNGYIALPRIFRQRTAERIKKQLAALRQLPLTGVLVRSYEELAFVKEHLPECRIITDHNLYCYNDCATDAFLNQGAGQTTVPLELNKGEILHRDNRNSMMLVYGYSPLMVSAQCVHANTKGCDRRPCITYLKDRYRTRFPMKNFCPYCYNVIYNSLPVLLFHALFELRQAGIASCRLDFTVESAQETGKILALYEEFAQGNCRHYPKEWENRYTNGHYKRGVE